MKILIAATDNPYINNIGGKHVHQLLLESSLKKLGFDIFTLYPPKERKIKKAFEILHKDPLALLSKAKRIKASITILMDFFRGQYDSFDIVNAHDVVSAYNIDHPNLVLTVHGYFAKEVFDYSLEIPKIAQSIYDFFLSIEKTSYEKARKIIAVDTRIKKYIEDEFHIPDEKIKVIYNAVDTDTFQPVSKEIKVNLRGKLNINQWKWIVLIPRRFVPKNGVIYAAKAVKLLKRRDVLFIFAGRGILEEQLKSELKGFDNVIITSITHDKIPDYYKASDIVLVPSVTSTDVEEATSLSMLEGMACGKVVICTNVGGMKEVIKDGENGFLIEQKSPEAIAEKIEYAIEHYNELEYIRKNAREYVEKNHSPIEHAKKFLEVFEVK